MESILAKFNNLLEEKPRLFVEIAESILQSRGLLLVKIMAEVKEQFTQPILISVLKSISL